MGETHLDNPDLPNVSLVACYSEKTSELKALIQKLQTGLAQHELIDSFTPYHLGQVHGTIIGCEGVQTKSGIVNKSYGNLRNETRYMNIPGLVDYLQYQVKFPFNICFGGYDLNFDYNFLSRNKHPYLRSFQLQSIGDKTIPVLIGWPWQNNTISGDIDRLRKKLQQFNLLHKYHRELDDVDNDFYLRIGTIDSPLTIEATEIIAKDIRTLLASQSTLSIPIYLQDLAFAQYQDLSFNPSTTRVFSAAKITSSQLEQLYSQSANTI